MGKNKTKNKTKNDNNNLIENTDIDDDIAGEYNTYEIYFANNKNRFEKEQKYYIIGICLGIYFVLNAALYLLLLNVGDRSHLVDTTVWEWIIAATGIIILIMFSRRLSRLRSCRQDLDDGFIKPVQQVNHRDTGFSDSSLTEIVSDDYYKKGGAFPSIVLGAIFFLIVLPFYVGALKKGKYIDWMVPFYPAYIVLLYGLFRLKKYRTIKELYCRGKLHIPNELKKEIRKNKKRK